MQYAGKAYKCISAAKCNDSKIADLKTALDANVKNGKEGRTIKEFTGGKCTPIPGKSSVECKNVLASKDPTACKKKVVSGTISECMWGAI